MLTYENIDGLLQLPLGQYNSYWHHAAHCLPQGKGHTVGLFATTFYDQGFTSSAENRVQMLHFKPFEIQCNPSGILRGIEKGFYLHWLGLSHQTPDPIDSL